MSARPHSFKKATLWVAFCCMPHIRRQPLAQSCERVGGRCVGVRGCYASCWVLQVTGFGLHFSPGHAEQQAGTFLHSSLSNAPQQLWEASTDMLWSASYGTGIPLMGHPRPYRGFLDLNTCLDSCFGVLIIQDSCPERCLDGRSGPQTIVAHQAAV